MAAVMTWESWVLVAGLLCVFLMFLMSALAYLSVSLDNKDLRKIIDELTASREKYRQLARKNSELGSKYYRALSEIRNIANKVIEKKEKE